MDSTNFRVEDREDNYKTMLLMLKGQISDEDNLLINLCNASAIINEMVDDINWAGFYLKSEEELLLGPFQGKPACNRIKIGKGVCGSAASLKKVMRVKNVHEFQGHIACDSITNSEIVVPIIVDGQVKGVLDIDSTKIGRFTEVEEKYFTQFVSILLKCKWN